MAGKGKHCLAELPVLVIMLCYVMLCYVMLCYVICHTEDVVVVFYQVAVLTL